MCFGLLEVRLADHLPSSFSLTGLRFVAVPMSCWLLGMDFVMFLQTSRPSSGVHAAGIHATTGGGVHSDRHRWRGWSTAIQGRSCRLLCRIQGMVLRFTISWSSCFWVESVSQFSLSPASFHYKRLLSKYRHTLEVWTVSSQIIGRLGRMISDIESCRRVDRCTKRLIPRNDNRGSECGSRMIASRFLRFLRSCCLAQPDQCF